MRRAAFALAVLAGCASGGPDSRGPAGPASAARTEDEPEAKRGAHDFALAVDCASLRALPGGATMLGVMSDLAPVVALRERTGFDPFASAVELGTWGDALALGAADASFVVRHRLSAPEAARVVGRVGGVPGPHGATISVIGHTYLLTTKPGVFALRPSSEKPLDLSTMLAPGELAHLHVARIKPLSSWPMDLSSYEVSLRARDGGFVVEARASCPQTQSRCRDVADALHALAVETNGRVVRAATADALDPLTKNDAFRIEEGAISATLPLSVEQIQVIAGTVRALLGLPRGV